MLLQKVAFTTTDVSYVFLWIHKKLSIILFIFNYLILKFVEN